MLIVGNIWMSEISVCIPTYEFKGEGVKFLSELFNSLEKQTFQDFDIVISDHSKDDAIYEFCKDSSDEFEITYIRNENGRGYQSTNTNCVLQNAEGRILKLIYQDDLFISDRALEKIKYSFDISDCKWLFHGFAHTTDGVETHRECVPKWTEMMLEGNNQLGSPSCVAFLNGYEMDMDEHLKLLIDTELYHRMRMEYGMPEFISDILIANREHDNRVSAGGIDYNEMIQNSVGEQWMVNSEELQHIYKNHKEFFTLRKYPDEN
jgi:glycosyltransferase involved in cell wall biosynthesis